MKQETSFDRALVKSCARSFSAVSRLGTVVSLSDGQNVASFGPCSCESCRICRLAGRPQTLCAHTRIHGMREAERFGGRYVYFCPLGLACFTAPILGENGPEAAITAGPFLMVDPQDYLRYDLSPRLTGGAPEEPAEEVARIPTVSASQVEDLSQLLFLATAFLNRAWASKQLLAAQESLTIQQHVSSHIAALKGETPAPYPFQTENELLSCVAHLDREGVGKRLNELLGYIFFSLGGNFQLAKSRICELLVLLTRTAVTAGADPNAMLLLTHEYIQTIPHISGIDELCAWLTKAVNRLMDQLFEFSGVKHSGVIHKAILYIRAHYGSKISLEDVAQTVYLSPAYFSRVFRQETGMTFNAYLNKVRVDASKGLLLDPSVRLIDAALSAGFESQSYFTKVFKKYTGYSPLQYREKLLKEPPQ